ncbi:ATP-binding cassette subfamily G member 4-like [Daktulosphaira vitifoliae]|uniref:ATP-binding cassette subfamily G member 4-like n=1 Tax=Daktulosphaira vitifoliae TaxID=58002 RepID=UPI0021AAD0BC|nr:ATP-binding cassette subfamily G member 4-like [Daktulosphaira vitifoliae]
MNINFLLAKKNVDIQFENITYKVLDWKNILKFKKKTILHGVSGTFGHSQLCAIIGCSGSGKSSLLNILSGYKPNGFNGTILINKEFRDLNLFKKQSCYIMQEEQLYSQLTVKEAMLFAAQLKFSTRTLDSNKLKLINDIINQLNFYDKYNTRTINLSGGEKRKLTIALELLHNPSVMFFDEPTTGLDSVSANQVLLILKKLSNSGRTIICTIHQASSLQLKMFDILYVLSPSGYCIYHGYTSNLYNFLTNQNLYCPLYHNIADFIIEVSFGEYGDHAYDLMKNVDNGKSPKWMNSSCEENALSNKIIPDERNEIKKRNRSIFIEIIILLKRFALITSREKFSVTRVMVHLLVSIVYGWIYYGIGNNALLIHDNLMLLFFSLMFIMFTASSTMIIHFPSELHILSKEYFNQWYALPTYYLSYTICDLPIQTLCTFLYCLFVYHFTGQPPEWLRFTYFNLMMLMVGLLSQAFGMFMGTIFTDLRFSTIFTSFFLMPWMMFGGVFIKISDTPLMFRWIFDISFMKHGMEAILHCVYGLNRPRLPCPEIFCYHTSPKKVLEELDMPINKYWYNLATVTSIYLIIKVLVYQTLKRKLFLH